MNDLNQILAALLGGGVTGGGSALAPQLLKALVGEGTTGQSSGGTLSKAAIGGAALSSMGIFGPLLSGLVGLLRGGEEQTAPVIPVFQKPAPVTYELGVDARRGWEGGEAVDHDARGRSRMAGGLSPETNVVVQVTAMDSRSFLDHSDEIAAAVRKAVLESNSLGSVLSEV